MCFKTCFTIEEALATLELQAIATMETELKDILAKFEQQFYRLDQRLDRIEADLTEIKVDMATVKAELTIVKEDTKDLKGRASAQIWALIVTIMGATTAAIVRFGFMNNP